MPSSVSGSRILVIINILTIVGITSVILWKTGATGVEERDECYN